MKDILESHKRENWAIQRGDWSAAAQERQHRETLRALEQGRGEPIPGAWLLAGALFAGSAIKSAVQGPVEPQEPQVVQARVIRPELPQRAPWSPPDWLRNLIVASGVLGGLAMVICLVAALLTVWF